MDIKIICKEKSCYWNIGSKNLGAQYLCSAPNVYLDMSSINRPTICKTYILKEKVYKAKD